MSRGLNDLSPYQQLLRAVFTLGILLSDWKCQKRSKATFKKKLVGPITCYLHSYWVEWEDCGSSHLKSNLVGGVEGARWVTINPCRDIRCLKPSTGERRRAMNLLDVRWGWSFLQRSEGTRGNVNKHNDPGGLVTIVIFHYSQANASKIYSY